MHVRRVPHMRCVMRATAVRACACVVTLYTLRSVRYQQRLRARARTRPPVPVCASPFFVEMRGMSSTSAVLSPTPQELPQDQGRAADQKGQNPGQRAQDPDPTHLTSTTVRDGEPGASHPQTTPAIPWTTAAGPSVDDRLAGHPWTTA